MKQGIMEKEGKRHKTWHKRYFILFEDGKLCYYSKEGDKESIGSLSVDVDGAQHAQMAQFGKNGNKFGYV